MVREFPTRGEALKAFRPGKRGGAAIMRFIPTLRSHAGIEQAGRFIVFDSVEDARGHWSTEALP